MAPNSKRRVVGLVTIGAAWALGATISVLSLRVYAAPDDSPPTSQFAESSGSHLHLDRSGRVQVGKASFYASRYVGRTMADGTPMRLYSNNAASLTLPLGTTAKVTNLRTGQSAVVTIRDRGPYVRGRIVDLSPITASKIGIDVKVGVARVSVAPIAVPQIDGTVRLAALR